MSSAPSSQSFFGVFKYSRLALALVWQTSPALSLWLGGLSLVCGLIPAAIAYVGKLIIDAIVHGARAEATDVRALATVVLVELGLVLLLQASQRGLDVCQSLLRALLGQRVNEMILEKALALDLAAFENAEFYDRMTRARREASSRPLSLVRRAFGIGQNVVSLIAYGALLLHLSLWAVAAVMLAAVPAFVIETKFSADAFRLFRWRSPETRKQLYLETVLAREDHAKEVKLFQLGPLFLARYRQIFVDLFGEDRALTLRRGRWGFVLGTLSTLVFYAAYAWIALQAMRGKITLGDMTMYLLVFKQAQSAVSALLSAIGGMYEDNLYLSNLYEYLDYATPSVQGDATVGPQPGTGIAFENVSFMYPGASRPALSDVSLRLVPGQKLALVGENGAGKTTLIKLLTRLYEPTAGRVTLDGLDLKQWNVDALRARVSAIFQDFVRYQLIVGENIGAGDVTAFDVRERWQRAAKLGMADEVVDKLPDGYDTQLGQWFNKGQELSVGQWQKIALSRAFMREHADIMVLDEPTASMDAEAEAHVFEHFSKHTDHRITIVISHRFSTVRLADQIVVMRDGAIVEQGSHQELMERAGRYARLFTLQADGYR